MTAQIFVGVMLMVGLAMSAGRAAEPVVLTFDQPETAGISGFRQMWDTPIVLAQDSAMGPGFLGSCPVGPD